MGPWLSSTINHEKVYNSKALCRIQIIHNFKRYSLNRFLITYMKVITRMGASVNSVIHSMLITCCTCAPLSIVVPTGLGVHAICDQLLRCLFLKELLPINILCCRKTDIHEFNIYLIFLIQFVHPCY